MSPVSVGLFVTRRKLRFVLTWTLLVIFSGQALAAPLMHLCDMAERQDTLETMVSAAPGHDCCPEADSDTVRDLLGAAASGPEQTALDSCNFCVQCPSPAALSLFTATSVAPQGRLALPALRSFVSFPTETLLRPPILA